MQYFAPRQLEGGRWDYTVRQDKQIYPVGYCAAHFEEHKCAGHHETKEQAIECYRTYLIDNANYDNCLSMNSMKRCEICGEWSLGYVTMQQMHYIYLCQQHRNREGVNEAFLFTGFMQVS